MHSDIEQNATRRTARALISAGLALVFAVAGLDAQQQQGQVTTDEIEEALSNPDAQLQEVQSQQSMKAVTLVNLENVYPDRQEADQVKEEHQDAIEKFRQSAREHETVTRALEAEGVSPEDVVAIHVGNPMAEGREGAEQQEGAEREEMAVHQVMYVVVDSDAISGQDRGEYEPGRTEPDTAGSGNPLR